MVDSLKQEILQVIEDRKNGIFDEAEAIDQYKPMLTLTSV
jgi:hypothetical protein